MIRVWTKAVEAFVLEVILEKRRGKLIVPLRGLLLALSQLFATLVKVRRFVRNM